MDNWLPHQRGSELCKILKTSADASNIPIILMSASSNLESIAKEFLADEYISKPFDIDHLAMLVKIAHYLGAKILEAYK